MAVVVSAAAERHSLLLEAATESEGAARVMRGLLEVAAKWGEAVELSGGEGSRTPPMTFHKSEPSANAVACPGTSSAEGGRQQEPPKGRKNSGRRSQANNREEENGAGRQAPSALQKEAPSALQTEAPSSSSAKSSEGDAATKKNKTESGVTGVPGVVTPRTAAATKLFSFATALEGLTMEEVAPPSDSDVVKRLNREEREYYHGLSKADKDSAVTTSREVLNTADSECVPQRFRVLWSRLPRALKKRILLKLDKQNESLAAGGRQILHVVGLRSQRSVGTARRPAGADRGFEVSALSSPRTSGPRRIRTHKRQACDSGEALPLAQAPSVSCPPHRSSRPSRKWEDYSHGPGLGGDHEQTVLFYISRGCLRQQRAFGARVHLRGVHPGPNRGMSH